MYEWFLAKFGIHTRGNKQHHDGNSGINAIAENGGIVLINQPPQPTKKTKVDEEEIPIHSKGMILVSSVADSKGVYMATYFVVSSDDTYCVTFTRMDRNAFKDEGGYLVYIHSSKKFSRTPKWSNGYSQHHVREILQKMRLDKPGDTEWVNFTEIWIDDVIG